MKVKTYEPSHANDLLARLGYGDHKLIVVTLYEGTAPRVFATMQHLRLLDSNGDIVARSDSVPASTPTLGYPCGIVQYQLDIVGFLLTALLALPRPTDPNGPQNVGGTS